MCVFVCVCLFFTPIRFLSPPSTSSTPPCPCRFLHPSNGGIQALRSSKLRRSSCSKGSRRTMQRLAILLETTSATNTRTPATQVHLKNEKNNRTTKKRKRKNEKRKREEKILTSVSIMYYSLKLLGDVSRSPHMGKYVMKAPDKFRLVDCQ